jgi:sialic acid synthase SpsE
MTIPHMADCHSLIVGLSDYTLGSAVSVAAVVMGANVIEKHVTLNPVDGGIDLDFSLELEELTQLFSDCQVSWLALGEIWEG